MARTAQKTHAGRPRLPEKKAKRHRVVVLFSDAELRDLESEAARAKTPLSPFIRARLARSK